MKNKVTKKKCSWLHYSWGDRLFLLVVYGVLIAVTLICIYPLYFTVIASFSDAYEIYVGNVKLWPKKFTMEAYTLVVQNKKIWTGYLNTILYTVLGTMFNLFLTIPAAYTVSKNWLPGRGIPQYCSCQNCCRRWCRRPDCSDE